MDCLARCKPRLVRWTSCGQGPWPRMRRREEGEVSSRRPMESSDEPDLPSAPRAPVAANGTVLFGRYLGHTGSIDWSRAGRSRLWRFLHAKRWQYASIIGHDCITAVAIADLGWATTAFAYLFDRLHRRVLADVSLVGLPRSSDLVADHAGPGARSCFRTVSYTHLTLP